MALGFVDREDGGEGLCEADGIAGETEDNRAVDGWEFAEEGVSIEPKGYGVGWSSGWEGRGGHSSIPIDFAKGSKALLIRSIRSTLHLKHQLPQAVIQPSSLQPRQRTFGRILFPG